MLARMKLAYVTTVAAVTLSLAGCVTINVPAPSSPRPADLVDDSAALQNVSLLRGALVRYIETMSDEDCGYVLFVQEQLVTTTPAAGYRGAFEILSNNSRLAAGSCGTQPSQALATTALSSADEILTATGFMGLSGSLTEPTPGAPSR